MSTPSADFSGRHDVEGKPTLDDAEPEASTEPHLEPDEEPDPHLPQDAEPGGPAPSDSDGLREEPAILADGLPGSPDAGSFSTEGFEATSTIPAPEERLFANYEYEPPPPPPRRKPDFGDCLLFAVLAFGASLCSGVLVLVAMHFHVLGVSTYRQANEEIHYRIGTQAGWYVLTLIFCILIFPLAWRRSFFEGLQWRAGAAASQLWRLIGAASACFVAAIVDQFVMPGPTNTPIDQTFRMPGAVWLLFGFGVTLAPLIEEITFRGLLLPALCTAVDWFRERSSGSPPPPLDADGFPRWSMPAMIAGSVLVSVPFALMHGEQTSYSIGPFLLLVCISMVLCWVRLGLKSLAASVVVHSSYNLLLFSLMFLGTGGFQHLDRM